MLRGHAVCDEFEHNETKAGIAPGLRLVVTV